MRPGRSVGESGATRQRREQCAAECGGAGRRAAAAAGVPSAGEDDRSGSLARAAQEMKCLGRRPRSERGKRGSWRSDFFTFSRAGIGHPPRWFSAGSVEVVAACGGVLGCWGGSGAFLGLWGR